MEQTMARLAQYQMSNFFEQNAPITQDQCNEYAAAMTGASVTPTAVQGGSSYTVVAGTCIVQFRNQDSPFDLEFFGYIEQAYKGFTPLHEGRGRLGSLHVYKMTNVGGVSMYLAREALHKDDFRLLGATVQSFARFFASAWHNTPAATPRKDPRVLSAEYVEQLTMLREGLPVRFRLTLEGIIAQLPRLFTEDWPQVPNHIDLLENNIHVDPTTGAVTGVCDWPGAAMGPFGMSLGGLETMLGVNRVARGFCYHPKQQHLRNLFHESLEQDLGSVSDDDRERMRVATLAGLFLENGFAYTDEGTKIPAGEGSMDLAYLDVVLPRLGQSKSSAGNAETA
ncbi:hypothetical protein SPBR_01851 [Sporothrix brasiliensis 5110]|uniref:Aminoglycoside phosphotransferase domain-containing protein n=1 Tax=Sporothrix brasiliensis 5110 TaxID=1398154 RepID=A0A0C2IQN4_9PEZI|nr:uncharacterized protein SPBR_01851 [Sporothrix brasiliensis 5110]KIH91346.1 hypothetical protein SPBR_01851 [Sporothrix brasiliensis 5110]